MLNVVITNCAHGMPKAYHVLKPISCLFFVGSHKCAYSTDIQVISARVKSLLFPPVFPDFPAPRGTHILFQPSRLPASALDHSATKTHFRYLDESKDLLWDLSARHD